MQHRMHRAMGNITSPLALRACRVQQVCCSVGKGATGGIGTHDFSFTQNQQVCNWCLNPWLRALARKHTLRAMPAAALSGERPPSLQPATTPSPTGPAPDPPAAAAGGVACCGLAGEAPKSAAGGGEPYSTVLRGEAGAVYAAAGTRRVGVDTAVPPREDDAPAGGTAVGWWRPWLEMCGHRARRLGAQLQADPS
jgi:hypothetical protein